MIIISGPSTVGKNPFIYKACDLLNLNYITPYTTRNSRVEEKNGIDYHFISKQEFQNKIKNGEIKNWDFCLGNYYGYSFPLHKGKNQITHGLSRMALRIKSQYPNEITTIFLMPINKSKILNNLKKIYNGKELLLREQLVEEEIIHSSMFDEILVCPERFYELLNRKELQQLLLL